MTTRPSKCPKQTQTSMLANTLNTNEVKNAAGTEVELQSLGIVGRSHTFAKIGESPAFPVRLSINHTEIATGNKARRRSNDRVDITFLSEVDLQTPVTVSAYIVLDAPVGHMTSMSKAADAIAMLLSFNATLGGTTVLYDGSGNGAQALLTGGL